MTAAASALALSALAPSAPADDTSEAAVRSHHSRGSIMSFRRIASLPNYLNNANWDAETVSEIVAATADGMTLVYTDSPGQQIGFVDITKPEIPISAGTVDMAGEPTSVAVLGNELALVAVDTSASLAEPSGQLKVVNISTRSVIATLALGGQPDSVAISPDGRFAAIAIENQRDEEVVAPDGVEGGLPQAPAGYLAVIELGGAPSGWEVVAVDLTGLGGYGEGDPEAEFVDINRENHAVVTLQENNVIAIVDLVSASVIGHFDAGVVALNGIDNEEDGLIDLSDSITGVAREPDAVAWVQIGGLEPMIATANEGDLFGGSRGFSLFERDGQLLYDSGSSLERIAVRHGHYPEDRSENKGAEPEAVEFARFDETEYLFVGSERGSFVAVYTFAPDGEPEFAQLLPGPFGPEGLLAIPSRNLLIASGENDDPPLGVRSTMMIYALEAAAPDYPQIESMNDADGAPIAWSALSGLTASAAERNTLLGVWDSYYSTSRVFKIDVSVTPALITEAVTIRGGSGDYDPEGIAVAPDGTWWVASEGNAGSRLNRLLHLDEAGIVIDEIGLPAEIEACRAASTSRSTLGSGFEGIEVVRTGRTYKLLIAQQRGWNYTTPECEALDDDLGDDNPPEPRHTRIWVYEPSVGAWDAFHYELEPLPENASWVGLSEITALPDGSLMVIERDNRTGDYAELKTLVRFRLSDAADGEVSSTEKASFDLVPAMLAGNGWITDKPEGAAVSRDGSVYVVTDNDGVEDWSGETSFLRLGRFPHLFSRPRRK